VEARSRATLKRLVLDLARHLDDGDTPCAVCALPERLQLLTMVHTYRHLRDLGVLEGQEHAEGAVD
jgi:hypothetical protein